MEQDKETVPAEPGIPTSKKNIESAAMIAVTPRATPSFNFAFSKVALDSVIVWNFPRRATAIFPFSMNATFPLVKVQEY